MMLTDFFSLEIGTNYVQGQPFLSAISGVICTVYVAVRAIVHPSTDM